MLPAQQLLAKVRRGEVTTGILATDHVWTDLIEISQRAGLDYVIVDMEHGAHSPDVVAEVCSTGRRMNFAVLIRPRANDYANLRLAIDLGCCGFLLASVESAAELDVVREAVHLPPRGRRRPAVTVTAGSTIMAHKRGARRLKTTSSCCRRSRPAARSTI